MTEQFCAGDAFEYAMLGVDEIPGPTKQSHKKLAGAIRSQYSTDITVETANVINRVNNCSNPSAVVDAIHTAGIDDATVQSLPRSALDEVVDDVEEPGLAEAIRLLDRTLSAGLCPRDSDAANLTSKREREDVYVPEVVQLAEGGTVYMAKTLSSTAKLRMAWDLNDSNQVVVVDDYEVWEQLLGWEKLKSLPHGKNQIRNKLGHKLSDEVLEIVAGERSGDEETKTDDSTGSRGRRTRTKPSEEVLNLALSRRQKKRAKVKSKNIAEQLDDDERVSMGIYSADMFVLFPTTSDLNMTDHWWVPGEMGDGNCAIAHCNKGTFEYLNQYDAVWHIEDYLDQAADYEFETNAGPLTMNVASTDNLVIHVVEQETKDVLMRETVMPNLPEVLVKYIEEEKYTSPPMPHPDDMVYAPITREDIFWMRPALIDQTDPESGDVTILYDKSKPRNLPQVYSISCGWWIYSRARLSDWDFDSIEMKKLDRADHYFKLHNGGIELVETLAQIHDSGGVPHSESPKSRWS